MLGAPSLLPTSKPSHGSPQLSHCTLKAEFAINSAGFAWYLSHPRFKVLKARRCRSFPPIATLVDPTMIITLEVPEIDCCQYEAHERANKSYAQGRADKYVQAAWLW